MRVVVVGLGVQGHKRRRVAGADFVAAVDPVNAEAEYRTIEDVPLGSYDAVLACIPDEPKIEILDYLLEQRQACAGGEAALGGRDEESIVRLEATAREEPRRLLHRLQPSLRAAFRAHARTSSRRDGSARIYHCRMFYGNGTARLVRESEWRDKGAGVLPDLGSHLLDTAQFWFGDLGEDFRVVSSRCFENRAPDHVVLASSARKPQLELEMTLLSLAQSLHLRSVCRERLGPYPLAVQMGARHHSRCAAACCRAGGRRGTRSLSPRTIRPGSSNTRISRRCAGAARSPICRNDIWLNRECCASLAQRHYAKASMSAPDRSALPE